MTLVSLFEIEHICVALNLGKGKWLIVGLYKPPNINETFFTNKLSAALNKLSKTYDNLLYLGDFNMTPIGSKLQEILVSFNLKNLIKEPTCFEGPTPRCIDLMLTNKKQYFMKSQAITTGISYFHKLTISILKSSFSKGNPKIILYRDYKNFNLINFNITLKKALDIMPDKNCYATFENTFLGVLNIYSRLSITRLSITRTSP